MWSPSSDCAPQPAQSHRAYFEMISVGSAHYDLARELAGLSSAEPDFHTLFLAFAENLSREKDPRWIVALARQHPHSYDLSKWLQNQFEQVHLHFSDRFADAFLTDVKIPEGQMGLYRYCFGRAALSAADGDLFAKWLLDRVVPDYHNSLAYHSQDYHASWQVSLDRDLLAQGLPPGGFAVRKEMAWRLLSRLKFLAESYPKNKKDKDLLETQIWNGAYLLEAWGEEDAEILRNGRAALEKLVRSGELELRQIARVALQGTAAMEQEEAHRVFKRSKMGISASAAEQIEDLHRLAKSAALDTQVRHELIRVFLESGPLVTFMAYDLITHSDWFEEELRKTNRVQYTFEKDGPYRASHPLKTVDMSRDDWEQVAHRLEYLERELENLDDYATWGRFQELEALKKHIGGRLSSCQWTLKD